MASTAGVADVWETWLDWLEETEQGTAQEVNQFLDEIEGETGVDLMDDVIEELTGGIAVALLPSTIRLSPAREGFNGRLEVWPESHWPGFALREADVFKTYMAWWCM